MLNRRKMFAAITAVGVSAVAADHAVAMAFDDGDYLRERTERLRLHETEMNRIDTERREWNAKNIAEQKVCDRYLAKCLRAQAFGDRIVLSVPYYEYEILAKHNLIDFLTAGDDMFKGVTLPYRDDMMIPTLMSMAIKVTA